MDRLISGYFESGYFEDMLDEVSSMIRGYVKRDTTAFCSYEDHLKAVDTIRDFCLLRAESVRGQLNGGNRLHYSGAVKGQIQLCGCFSSLASGYGRAFGPFRLRKGRELSLIFTAGFVRLHLDSLSPPVPLSYDAGARLHGFLSFCSRPPCRPCGS